MQRISVDLPEPDGPITTTTSWRPTRRSMSSSAWKSPKRLVDAVELDHHLAAAGHDGRVGEHRRVIVIVPPPVVVSMRWLSRDSV